MDADDFSQSMDVGWLSFFVCIISFSYVLCFSVYKSFAFLIKIILKDFIFFDVSINGIIFSISF